MSGISERRLGERGSFFSCGVSKLGEVSLGLCMFIVLILEELENQIRKWEKPRKARQR